MAEPEVGESPRPTVVVADDEVHVVDLIAQLLEDLGIAAVKVFNGEAAFIAVLEHRPRLLITDVMMPKLRGDEVARRIKAHPEMADVKVLIVTSQPRESVADAPADAFVAKPFDLDNIERLILEHLADA